jgi:hypothetical protein
MFSVFNPGKRQYHDAVFETDGCTPAFNLFSQGANQSVFESLGMSPHFCSVPVVVFCEREVRKPVNVVVDK